MYFVLFNPDVLLQSTGPPCVKSARSDPTLVPAVHASAAGRDYPLSPGFFFFERLETGGKSKKERK